MFYIKKWSAHDLTPEEKEASYISMKKVRMARELIKSLMSRPFPNEDDDKEDPSSSRKNEE